MDGKDKEEALGWASEWRNSELKKQLEDGRETFPEALSEETASIIRRGLQTAKRMGVGSFTLEEKRSKARAERKAKKAEQELQALESLTFGELMTEYLAWAKTNKRHWANDEYRYRLHLSEYLADKPLKDINPFLLEKIRKALQDKELAPSTIGKHCLVIVRQTFNKAIAWGKWHGENPTKRISMPKLDNAKQRALTMQEEEVLMANLKGKSLDTWGMAMVALYAGLRFEEIAKMRWSDVDLDKAVLTVRENSIKSAMFPCVPSWWICSNIAGTEPRVSPDRKSNRWHQPCFS